MLQPNKIGSIGSETFELKKLFIALNQLVGEYMNVYGLNNIDNGITVF